MHEIQAMINGMSQEWQKERSGTQMTLGDMIGFLEKQSASAEIGLGELDSYRGYYCDLAFEPATEKRTVEAILKECRAAMGKVFEGYKGGDYLMGESTPLWVAQYGSCGKRLMEIGADGSIETAEEEDDD